MTVGARIRKVDRKATAAARARQKAGIKRLKEAFGGDAYVQMRSDLAGIQTGRWRSPRLRPNVPPPRFDEQADPRRRARRLHRKRARAARKRNRRT